MWDRTAQRVKSFFLNSNEWFYYTTFPFTKNILVNGKEPNLLIGTGFRCIWNDGWER